MKDHSQIEIILPTDFHFKTFEEKVEITWSYAVIFLLEGYTGKAKEYFKKLENIHPGFAKKFFRHIPYLAEIILKNPAYDDSPYMLYCASYSYIDSNYEKYLILLSKASTGDNFSDIALYEYMELLLKNNDPQTILSIVALEKIKDMSSVLMKKAYDVYIQAHYNYFDADIAYKKCRLLQQNFGQKYLNNSSVYYLHNAVLLEENGDIKNALKLYEQASKLDGFLNRNSFGVFTVNEKESFSFSMPEHIVKKSAEGDGTLHLAACDQLYFDKHALAFIESLPTDKRIHLLIINPDSTKNNEHILKRFNNVAFSYINYQGDHLKPFYAFCRFFYASEISSSYQAPIIISNIDIIWNQEDSDSLLSKEFEYSVIARTEKKYVIDGTN